MTVQTTPTRRRRPGARIAPLQLAADRRRGSIFDAPDAPNISARDLVFRRSLVLADALAASLALWIGVMVLGDDALRPAAALFVPTAIIVSKAVGLYDRDELTLRKNTLDELPALAQIATAYVLVAWLVSPFIVDGTLGRDQGLGLWGLLLVASLIGRSSARALARRATTPERCLLVGNAATGDRLAVALSEEHGARGSIVSRIELDEATISPTASARSRPPSRPTTSTA